MTLGDLHALHVRLANAAMWAVSMRASIRPWKSPCWICSCVGPGGITIAADSNRADVIGWCESIERCHESWRAAVRNAPS